jgi:hypothetical protein
MQTLRSALVPLLLAASCSALHAGPAKPPKTHTVALGPVRKVPYTPPETEASNKAEESSTLRIRPLFVDDRQREWTVGETHEITDRSFTIRRALHINDKLPTDTADRWTWQPGPWLLVDRTTGHITALHLPDFDPEISEAVWFRDYAAYCGTSQTAKPALLAIVAQLGARRAIVAKQIGPWPQPNHFIPVCQPAQWQRQPLRVTLQPTAGAAETYAIVGTASLVEESEDPADEN